MKRFCTALFLSLGLAYTGAAAFAQAPDAAVQPVAQTTWEWIDEGLTRLAAGDGKAAKESFWKAGRTDDSGFSELLMDLTQAYLDFDPGSRTHAQDANQRLAVANQRFYELHIPPAVLGEALTRIRKVLKRPSAQETSPALLRPLLCNLRLLARDVATEGEPVLEPSGASRDMGPLTFPRPLFNPPPPFTDDARLFRTHGNVVIELIVDSEGCPRAEKLLKPLPQGLAEQTLATLKWWAFEPARYDGAAVGWKLVLTTRFTSF
jgi:hypothetical protein